MSIHETTVIYGNLDLEEGATVGPFCVIRGNVRIGKGTHLLNNVSVGCDESDVWIGENNTFFPGAYVGGVPQDKKYQGEQAKVVIGNDNIIRECVTVSIGTKGGGGVTEIGNNNLIMAYTHFGHDCVIGNSNVIANGCQFSGHVIIENNTHISGMCGFNQNVRIGSYCFIGGDSAVNKDILPYSMAQGNHAVIRGTNKVGLKRAEFTSETIDSIHKSIRILTKGSKTVSEALERIKNEVPESPHISHLLDFTSGSDRGIAL